MLRIRGRFCVRPRRADNKKPADACISGLLAHPVRFERTTYGFESGALSAELRVLLATKAKGLFRVFSCQSGSSHFLVGVDDGV